MSQLYNSLMKNPMSRGPGKNRQLQQIQTPRYSARLKEVFDNLEADETAELWAYSNIDILFFPIKKEAWLAAAFDLKHYQVETPLDAVNAYFAGGLQPESTAEYTDDDIFMLTDKGRQALGAQ